MRTKATTRPRRLAARRIAACAVVAALASACGAAATRGDGARADDHAPFPERMPMVTYYSAAPEGPLGPAVRHESIDADNRVSMVP